MAISNYTQLKDQLLRYIHRDDFDTDFDIFIGMVESEIFNNPIEILDSNFLEVSADLVSVDGSKEFDLPADYLTMRSLRIDSNGVLSNISYKSPEQISYKSSTGLPTSYTIFANKIVLDIVPDEIKSFKLDYIKEFAGLTEINTTNEVLSGNPNIYFYGCMWAAKMLEEELNDAEFYYGKLIQAIKGSNKKAKRSRYGSNLAMNNVRNIENINIIK